jgi:hypothetical protein
MRKLLLLLVICTTVFTGFAQVVGIGTTTPDPAAQLDVTSTNKGFLPPRVALTATNVASPVTIPPTGLLVYNTATAGVSPYNVSPGYYYWNGSGWYPVINKGNAFGDMQYWDGTKWILIPIGNNGAVLTICNGIPTWGTCSPVTISPSNNVYEGVIDSYTPNSWLATTSGSQIDIAAWTNGGPENRRTCIKFDYSVLPATAIIDNATLYLYSNPSPQAGNFVDAQYGSNNAGYIQRITTPWTVPGQFTWNTPPSSTTTNQAIIPQSSSTTQSSTIDVTNLVKDMITNGNNGFYIRLQTEVTYNIRQWGSSGFANPALHPKLIIAFH